MERFLTFFRVAVTFVRVRGADRRVRIFMTITSMLCFYSFASGQKVSVVDFETGNPVSGVTLTNSQNVGASTNDNGQTSLEKFNADDILLFQHTSYNILSLSLDQIKQMGYTVKLKKAIFVLPMVVASASKMEESIKDVPYKIDVITGKDIKRVNAQTTADLLESSGNVMIQKSQMGGGSPVIRGFEANKVLLVVDGVRMNNAIYRSGHLQNAITIDNSVLERAEVVFGPSSVIYGSDALGGVMHFYTQDPKLSSVDTMTNVKFNGYARYSSVNQENTTHVDVNIGFKKLGLLTSYTASKFGDLKTGNIRNHGYDDFGKTFHYADTLNGQDTMMVNDDVNLQVGTGYSQFDLLQKVYYRFSDSANITLNIQRSTSSDVPRFSSLNDYRDGVLRFAEWNYGPQNRLLTSLRFKRYGSGFFYDRMTLTAAYQRIDEDRISRRFGSNLRNYQKEDVKVFSFNADLVRKVNTRHRVNYGIEVTHNDVQSEAYDEDINTLVRSSFPTRYPDGSSDMQTYALYVTDKIKVTDKTSVLVGARNNVSQLRALFNDTTFVKLPFERISLLNNQMTGSASLIINPDSVWKINLIAATGFRSPNVDDVGKVREQDNNVIVPNNDLRAEHAYNAELGVSRFFNDQKFVISTAGFFTFLNHAIVRRDFQLGKLDSLLYAGEMARIQANQNSNQAIIYGTNINLVGKVSKHFALTGSYNFTYGRDVSNDTPLAHIPPTFGRAGVRYFSERFNCGFLVKYAGWKRIEDFALSGEDNEDEATADGSPSWYTLNANATYSFKKYIQLQVGLDNILDHHYKPFSSGVSAPGRNLSLTFRLGV